MSIFVKLNQAADKVLKGQVAAPECKEMTVNEYAAYATDQIEKAAEERDENPALATARLKSLAISNAVAQTAFEKLSLDKFEIPVFGANAEMDISVMAKLDAIMDSVDKAKDKDKNPFASKDKDKKAADEKEAADKKAADEKTAADKKAAGDKTAADEKEAADKKAADDKAEADKKAADTKKGEGGEEVDEDGEVWPQDMAKGLSATSDEKKLYDWGQDPPEVRANMPGHG